MAVGDAVLLPDDAHGTHSYSVLRIDRIPLVTARRCFHSLAFLQLALASSAESALRIHHLATPFSVVCTALFRSLFFVFVFFFHFTYRCFFLPFYPPSLVFNPFLSSLFSFPFCLSLPRCFLPHSLFFNRQLPVIETNPPLSSFQTPCVF